MVLIRFELTGEKQKILFRAQIFKNLSMDIKFIINLWALVILNPYYIYLDFQLTH